ncbi:MAG: hypothetical protein MJ125_06715 [Clostridia bacterium]|nr:hypothetical protein [Clostridia bacterium]
MSSFTVILVRIVSVIMSVIFIPLSGLTYGLDAFTLGKRNDKVIANVVGIGAYFRSQGIACDGEHFYFSSKTTLIKTEDDAKTFINADFSAIPDELKELGIKHIGGMSYYNGKIYAGMEDSKVWDYPIVGVFDADTLQLENYFIMDDEVITRGMPWVTVDPETGCLWCADHSKKPTKLLCYDTANDMSFVSEVPLSESVPSIQGAEFFEGFMYAATNDDSQAIYKIDTATGSVEKFLDRNLTGGEGEGMTFITRDGVTKLVAMDMGVIFVDAFIREYDM